ncbi:MAG: dihydroorotase [Acidobacteriota bacterium]
MNRHRIRGATVVLPSGLERVDVLVEGTTILGVDPPRAARADEVIQAAGLHLLPGVVDDQVHFREPGLEHKEDLHTGSLACAKGGVTTFLEMPNTDPTTTTVERLHKKLDRAASKCVVNYGFYIGATGDNVDQLVRAHRTPGIKIFIGSSTGPLLVDDQEALERIFAEGSLPITAHCEDETTVRANRERLRELKGDALDVTDHSRIRDHAAARIATARAIDLAERHGRRFHVLHVSTADEVELVRAHLERAAERLITAEACTHHLFFSIDDYERLGTRAQMNPSLKTPGDVAALWRGLDDGLLQVIATDHAPHTLDEKAKPYPDSPSGLPAVENSLALLLDQVHHGRCTLRDVVRWMCEAPARVWDVVGKGRIEEGFDADLVLVDLAQEKMVRDEEQVTRSGWSPWHGTRLVGWPVRTIVGGETVYADGRLDAGARGREALFDHHRGGYWAAE